MRAGQPCLAHAVGGLKDTVRHGENGFAFSGQDPAEQAAGCVNALEAALDLRAEQRATWRAIERAAAAARFSWADTARTCIDRLYAAS